MGIGGHLVYLETLLYTARILTDTSELKHHHKAVDEEIPLDRMYVRAARQFGVHVEGFFVCQDCVRLALVESHACHLLAQTKVCESSDTKTNLADRLLKSVHFLLFLFESPHAIGRSDDVFTSKFDLDCAMIYFYPFILWGLPHVPFDHAVHSTTEFCSLSHH